MSDVNLEEEIATALSQSIAEEIDFSILSTVLLDIGWTKVVLKPMTGETSQEIDQWVAENKTGHCQTLGLVWLFEHPKDAMWFKLRWMT